MITPPRRSAGFTMIELLVTIAIAVILLTVVVPNFRPFLAKKDLEGVMSNLVTDLQYARSEAVQRNVDVQVTFATGCYIVHLASATGATCGGVTPADAAIKTVAFGSSTTALSQPGGLTRVRYDAVRGTATFNGGDANAGTITGTAAAGGFQLNLVVRPAGRLQLCSPNTSVAGYSACS